MRTTACFLALSAFAFGIDDPLQAVRGIVLDARTRTPVRGFDVDVRVGLVSQRVVTDDLGRFETSALFRPDEILFSAIDHEKLERPPRVAGLEGAEPAPVLRHPWKQDGGECELQVDCGLEFALTIVPPEVSDPPIRLETCVVRLTTWAPGSIEASAALQAPLRLTDPKKPWVRFAPLPKTALGVAPKLKLSILTSDGWWGAEAEVASTTVTGAAPVRLVLAPRARWSGRVRDPSGVPLGRTWLTLERLGDRGQVLERWRQRCDGEGRYAFQALVPSDYILRGAPLRYLDFTSERRTLLPRADSKLDVTVDSTSLAGPVSGRIACANPAGGSAAPPRCTLVLRRAGESLPLEHQAPEWRLEADRWCADFLFATLPTGEYEVHLYRAAEDTAEYEPRVLSAKAPADKLSFVRQGP